MKLRGGRDERQNGNETVQRCKCGGAACKGAKVNSGVGLITLDQPFLEVPTLPSTRRMVNVKVGARLRRVRSQRKAR